MPSTSSTPLPECIFGDRLSPGPDDRNRRFIFDARVSHEQEVAWETQVRRQLRAAVSNPTLLDDYSFAAHQDWADTCGPPEPDAPSWRAGPEKWLSRDHPTVVVGHDESVGMLYIPRFIYGSSLTNFSYSTETHMLRELPSPVVKMASDLFPSRKLVAQRHLHDIDRFDLGCAGCRHYGLWHATGHHFSDSFEPTRDTTKNSTNFQWSSRIQYFHSLQPIDYRVNYLTWLARPDFYDILTRARQGAVTHPGFAPFDSVWNTPYLGRAVLVNRQSGEHLDVQGVRRAWDVIIAGGDFQNGPFYFKDMNVYCPFMPGDLVAFDGTAQRHRIEPFTGRLRLSQVYFIHRSILNELDISNMLSDLYLSDLTSRLAPYTRPPPVQGPPLPPGLGKGKGKRYAPVDRPDRTVQSRKKNRH